MKIRIVGVCASHRKGGNNELFVKTALDACKITDGVETQLITLAGKTIKPCTNCRACVKTGTCVVKDDWWECFRPLVDPVPDGVIISAPVYFYDLNSQTRAFFERSTSLKKALFFKGAKQTIPAPDWSRTAAGAMAIGYDRNGGQEHAMAAMIHWFLTSGFVSVGCGHIGYIGAPGWLMDEYQKDSISKDLRVGIYSAKELGRRVATTAHLLKYGQEALKDVLPPEVLPDTALEEI